LFVINSLFIQCKGYFVYLEAGDSILKGGTPRGAGGTRGGVVVGSTYKQKIKTQTYTEKKYLYKRKNKIQKQNKKPKQKRQR